MAKRTVEESSLTAVADAIRKRAGTSEPLVFPEGFISKIETLGEIILNVVGGTNKPTDPTQNTVWVNTDSTVSGYCVSRSEPSEPSNGFVWITSSAKSVVALEVTSTNPIVIYPVNAKQYNGTAWVEKEIEIYQDDAWRTPFVSLMGETWMGTLLGTYYGGVHSVDNRNDVLTIDGSQNFGTFVYVENQDLENYDTFTANISGSISSFSTIRLAVTDNIIAGEWGIADVAARTDKITASGEYTLDISSLSGRYYVGFFLVSTTSGGLSITGVALK